MTIFHAILLSIIEGITEFLPISSTGHLILTANLLNIPPTDFAKSFEIFIQLGAILAVVTLFGKKLFIERSLIQKVIVSFIPTAIAGFVLYPFIKNVLLESSLVVAWALILGGIILVFIEKFFHNNDNSAIGYRAALIIGIFQSLSLIPGVSRAGATIIGALILGYKRATAVEYSFFLAIPTMAAAVGWDMIKSIGQFSSGDMTLFAVGFVGSYITALLTIKAFIGFIKNNSFVSFGVYRILIGTLFLFA